MTGSPLAADIHAQVSDLLIKSDKGSQWAEPDEVIAELDGAEITLKGRKWIRKKR